jgi:NADH-quinone oxidoreductase subunit E
MKHLIPEFDKLKRRYPAGFEASMLIPCLRRIQQDRGYIADSDIDELVEYLGVSRIRVDEVLSFYTQFRRQPIGRWHIQTCRSLSCCMRGAERVLGHIESTLGIAPGETTADGRFTLSTVECLASCGTAPVVMINDTYHESMTPAALDSLLEGLE